MPVDFLVDHKHQSLLLTMHGDVKLADLLAIERKIVSLSDASGCNTIADLRKTERMPQFSADQIQRLAFLFLRSNPSKSILPLLAMVVDDGVLYDMARLFEGYCNEDLRGRDRVAIFRTLDEAAGFLRLTPEAFPEPVPDRVPS